MPRTPMKPLLGAVTIALFLHAGTSWAVLVSLNDAVFGVGAVTGDTDTGLEWLDLSITTNISLNALSAQLGPGGAFAGWHFATEAEVTELWANQGVPTPFTGDFAFGTPANDGALNLNSFLDAQLIGANSTTSFGFILELSTISPFWWQIDAATNNTVLGSTSSSFLIADFDTPSPLIGSYLVRGDAQAVPAPVTLALMGIGLVGLGFGRRRQLI